MGWFYINDENLEANKRFDCLLPEAYWYEHNNQTMKTTYCYVLPVGAFQLVCNLLKWALILDQIRYRLDYYDPL